MARQTWTVNERERTAVGPSILSPYTDESEPTPWRERAAWLDSETVGMSLRNLTDGLITAESFPAWMETAKRTMEAVAILAEARVPLAVPTSWCAVALWSDEDGVVVDLSVTGEGRITPESVPVWTRLCIETHKAVESLMALDPPPLVTT